MFYSALHSINEYFELHNIELPENHRDRKEIVKKELQHIYVDYCRLFNLSMRSRYIVGYKIFDLEVKHAKKYHANIIAHLNNI